MRYSSKEIETMVVGDGIMEESNGKLKNGGGVKSEGGALMAEEGRPVSSEILNPFVHRLELETTYDKLKAIFLTIFLLPVRLMAITALVIMAWLLACVGLHGLSEEDLRKAPLKGWRRKLRVVTCWVMRAFFVCGGFHYLRVKGRQASFKEAPILALAPHSTFFDALPVTYLGGPSIVAKAETSQLPFFGKLINYTQPVYVWRDDPNSRQNTVKEIIERATSKEDWPQVMIFPEGTCTNRSCLITFKSGAFYPGVPVQPVCIRYPNKLDTVTWTWEGPGVCSSNASNTLTALELRKALRLSLCLSEDESDRIFQQLQREYNCNAVDHEMVLAALSGRPELQHLFVASEAKRKKTI
ncbi:lysophosphatidylcholine acyltransferase [Copidosoma floridanum]|uniref:lysophosphatidylcholine acyltransferase n=1 Tax=Copidosoma floridanum TaxID=29053 RepID=UPI0006C9AF55|nr:lysophosphatidylcholine acyltransferase [Copidosoma floridanum]